MYTCVCGHARLADTLGRLWNAAKTLTTCKNAQKELNKIAKLCSI